MHLALSASRAAQPGPLRRGQYSSPTTLAPVSAPGDASRCQFNRWTVTVPRWRWPIRSGIQYPHCNTRPPTVCNRCSPGLARRGGTAGPAWRRQLELAIVLHSYGLTGNLNQSPAVVACGWHGVTARPGDSESRVRLHYDFSLITTWIIE